MNGEQPRDEQLRLFVGLRPGPDAVTRLVPQIDAVRDAMPADVAAALRPVEPADWHVTLQFLGAVDGDDVDRVRLACAFGAGRVRPFTATYQGLGAFPTERRARYLWIAVTEGADEIASLATSVQAQTAKLGWEPGGRDYVAHLTVARARASAAARSADPVDVEPLVGSCAVGPVRDEVGEIVLYRSRGGGAGARYVVVDTFPLQS